MATAALGLSASRMSVGRVFERAFATIGHNPAVTIGIALLFGGVPTTAISWGMSYARQTAFSQDYSTAFFVGLYVVMFLTWVLSLAIASLVQGVLTRATVAESEGRKASVGECVRAAFPVILPLIGLSILIAIGVMAGFIILIVPGIMLYLAWSVAAPALVEERRGIRGAFRRSWELTRGSRWKIFAVILILYIIYFLISGVFGILSMWILGGRGLSGFGQNLGVGYLVFNLVLALINNLLWGAVQASLYVELRDWKDGPSVQNLEDVFA